MTFEFGLKAARTRFFKNQSGIFDYECHRKVGSKNGAQRMRCDVDMVQIEEKLIPDLKRGENFLSSSIQYIYRLTYQSASLTFKCHANCIKKSKVHLLVPHI